MLRAPVPDEGPDPRGRRDRRGRLPGDDVEVRFAGDGHVAEVALLADLALREGRAHLRGQVDDVVVELPADPERSGEQEITGHESLLEAVLEERRGAAPALRAPVVDVVVDERRAVDQLEGRGDVHRTLDVLAAGGLKREERDHGPDPLSPGRDDVLCDLCEEGLLRSTRSSS